MTDWLDDDGDERFADWLDGRMSARERERFEAELRVNKRLQERAQAYRRTAEALREAYSGDGMAVDVRAALAARLTQSPAPTATALAAPAAPRGGGWSARWKSGLVAAAALVFLVAISQVRPGTPQPSALPPVAAAPAGAGIAADAPLADLDQKALRFLSTGDPDAEGPIAGLDRRVDGKAKHRRAVAPSWIGGASDNAMPQSVVPCVLLRRVQAPAPEQSGADPTGAAAERALDEAMKDAATLPARALAALPHQGVKLVPLPVVPGMPAEALPQGGGEPAVDRRQAWWIEGPQDLVYGYLAEASEAFRQRGFAVQNSEAMAASVLAMLPAEPERELAAHPAGSAAAPFGVLLVVDPTPSVARR